MISNRVGHFQTDQDIPILNHVRLRGLTAQLLAPGTRTFVHNADSGQIVPEPSADEEAVEVQDCTLFT
eukprot:2135576-Amphidinium_carterae.1